MPRSDDRVDDLLRQFDVTAAPVPVERIAEGLGATVSRRQFEDSLSGILLRLDDKTAAIAVNASHPSVRQRFTIAHEIGHLILHEGRPMFVDRLVRINLRHELSARPSREETAANRFAAELLMPESLLMGEIVEHRELRLDAESLITRLAEVFMASPQAMEYRLAELGLSVPR